MAPELDAREDLDRQIDAMRVIAKDLELLPSGYENDVTKLINLLRTGEITLTVSTLGLGMLASEYVIDKIEDHERAIEQTITSVFNKLNEFQTGVKTPITFIDKADDWRKIRNKITDAGSVAKTTNLRSEWEGVASERYFIVYGLQNEAFVSIAGLCEKIAVQLETLAKAILDLYKKLVTALLEFKNEIAGKMAGIWIKGPAAVLVLDDLVKSVGTMQTKIFNTFGECATMAQNNMIAGNTIAAEVATQSGLPFNKWPSIHVEATGVDSEGKPHKYDLDYADASVLDGDGSDWKARSTS
ncbi:hypothetical protein [Nocardia bovistercoris]|uniref:Uncharacterized protein n=1 Tax=Nocardia bovistercoris TaxID=2785916 RepID=A0A931IHI4_9NOCA|nr:hypothetical protein [Nocardia bovistercoris]MBH0781887.1 hypothetical protein [Nocardia bovistercoris]